MKCDLCEFETESRERFAGHRSGHARRGEVEKRTVTTEHRCKICSQEFPNGFRLGGHMRVHDQAFDELKSTGAKKRRLLREEGRKCSVCENTTWLGQPIPIAIDHIDGNPDNNERQNLRLICPNCHAQTATFSGKNIGNHPNSSRMIARKTSKM